MNELFRRFGAQPALTARLLVASLVIGLLALSQPIFVSQVLNRYLANGVDSTLVTLTVGVTIAVLVEFGLREIRLRMAAVLGAGPDATLSKATFAVLTNARAGALERVPAAARAELVRHLDSVSQAYAAPNLVSVLDIPFAIIFLVMLLAASVWLWLATVLAIAAAVALAVLGQRAAREPAKALAEAHGNTTAMAGAVLSAADTVRAFNAGDVLRKAWDRQLWTSQELGHRVTSSRGLVQSLNAVIAGAMSIAIIAIGAVLVVKGELSSGALIGCNILAARALQPLSRLAAMAEPLAKAEQAMADLREFARLPLESARGAALPAYGGRMELADVAFAHPGGTGPLFEHLSLNVAPGSVVAVLGENGSGKTTLARLLVGLIDPVRGQVLVDGLDLRQVAPEWWRRQVTYVPQEPGFITGTLDDNLRAGRPDGTDEERAAAVAAAGLQRFVSSHPQGYALPMNDQGRGLALGIRRRIALARALITGGRLVVIDEPFEGLDAEGCAAMRAAIQQAQAAGRSIFVFSHDANAIAVLGLPGGPDWLVDLSAKPVPRLQARPPAASQAKIPQVTA